MFYAKIHGSEKDYPNLKEATGYPDDILGLGGVYCRHRMFPFIPGISTPNPLRFSEEENRKRYELSQKQRAFERKIRSLKKQRAAAQAIGDGEQVKKLNKKVKETSAQLNDFCNKNKLKRDFSRELVSEQLVKKNVAKTQNSDIMLMSRNTKNTGTFADVTEKISKKRIREVAKKYKIDIKGLSLSIDNKEEMLDIPYAGLANPDKIGEIIFFPTAFTSEEELLRTLYHEKIHIEQFKEFGGEYVQENRNHFEQIAYKKEDEFIDNLKRKGDLH